MGIFEGDAQSHVLEEVILPYPSTVFLYVFPCDVTPDSPMPVAIVCQMGILS